MEIGAGLVAAGGLLVVSRVVYGVVHNLSHGHYSTGGLAVFLVLNSITLLFGLFVLLLGSQLWRGRTWAWIVSLVMLPFAILFAGLDLTITGLGGHVSPSGAALLPAGLAAMLILTVPRTSRAYFLRRAVPAVPVPGYYPPA